MRKITQTIASAFMNGEVKSMSNTKTDGKNLWLFGNKIAEHREDGMYISNAGWKSQTTKERLNGLPNVNISSKKGNWHLNGEEWDGDWIKVCNDAPPKIDIEKAKNVFDASKKWVATDGWRGYEEPLYAVCGVNDTGMWDDSPCKSDVAEKEIKEAISILKKNKIPTKIITSSSSNVFCIRHYAIVPPYYIEKAKELMEEYYEKAKSLTQLLYTT